MNGAKNIQIEAIQASGYSASIVVTGGGVAALSAILTHPGASRFVLEVQIPYCSEALTAYLGELPEQACSEKTARFLAIRAFERASHLAPHASIPLGISCTAALQTNRERRGSDRACIGIKSLDRTVSSFVKLGPETRQQQDDQVATFLLAEIYKFVKTEI